MSKPEGFGNEPDELSDDGDLTDMLGELRVLLPTAQLLSAFLITVPFTPGFSAIANAEKWVFLATFVLAVVGLVLLSAPAVQHRLIRPLLDRPRFKSLASRQILVERSRSRALSFPARSLYCPQYLDMWSGAWQLRWSPG